MIAETNAALRGVWRVVRGAPGYENDFDVSAAGFWRSFLAAVIALPAFAFTVAAYNRAALTSASADPERILSLAHAATVYAVVWLHFPIAALAILILLGRTAAFARWTVVHNWTTAGLLFLQATPFVLLSAGVASQDVIALLFLAALLISVYAHWRVADATLGPPWAVPIGAACAHVLIARLLHAGVDRAFLGAPGVAS